MANPVDELLKHAGFFGNAAKNFMGGVTADPKGASGFAGAMGAQLPGSVAAGAVAGVGLGLAKGFGMLHERLTKTRDFKAMLQANPALHEYDAGHTQMVYNSLRSLAPSLAKDPLVAGSFVHGMLNHPGASGPMIPPATAKMLVDTQRNMEGRSMMQQMMEAAGKAGPLKARPEPKPLMPPHPVQEGYDEQSTEREDAQGRKTRTTHRDFRYKP